VEERRRKEEREREELRSAKHARQAAQSVLRGGQLSAEEKARRLAEMQADAAVNESMRTDRLIKAHYKDRERLAVPGQVHGQTSGGRGSGVGRAGDGDEGGGTSGAFLQQMRQEVYSGAAGGDAAPNSLAQRLQQNKHYVQRGVDLDQDSHGSYRKN
jgi:hypothetical protein